MITKDEAKAIIDAFGAGSIVAETMTVKEVIAEVEKVGSPRAFIETTLIAEDVLGDRMAATAREQEASGEKEYEDRHFKVVAEEVEFLVAVRERCEGLMKARGW